MARKTEIVKNERCTIRKSPSNGPWQALHDTHRQIPQRRDLHTVAGGAKPVPFVKLNSRYKLMGTGYKPVLRGLGCAGGPGQLG